MSFDLSGNLKRTLRSTLRKAEEFYHEGQDEQAASSFDAAHDLLLRLAEKAPDRQTELEQKQKAVKYREFANKLRSGEVPPPQPASEVGGEAGEDGRPAEHRATEKGAKGGAPGTGELQGIVQQMIHTSQVTWDQIGGLDAVKAEIKYALGITMAQKPEALDLATWRNMLFYGPPGTGKTLLAAATSNALKLSEGGQRAVFYNVKVSSVLSKYFGESSKIISELYGTARDTSPSVVFLDEFESIGGSRGGEDESGPERRILSTILAELDGLSEKGRSDIYVLTVAATNRPWDLDPAVLSRFDKKILIPLPGPDTRREILAIHLVRKGFEVEADMEALVALTDGFSGREIERFCKEVTNRMIAEENEGIPGLVDQGLDAVRSYRIRVRPLRAADFQEAAHRITPQTSPQEMTRYEEWRENILEG